MAFPNIGLSSAFLALGPLGLETQSKAKQYIPACPDKLRRLEYIIEQSSNESMIIIPFGCELQIQCTEKALLKLIGRKAP